MLTENSASGSFKSRIHSLPTEPVPAQISDPAPASTCQDSTAEAPAASAGQSPDAAAPVIPQIHVEAVQETQAEVQGELLLKTQRFHFDMNPLLSGSLYVQTLYFLLLASKS